MSDQTLFVIKRNGRKQSVFPDKISARIRKLSYWLGHVDCDMVANRVIDKLVPGIDTWALDELAADICYELREIHPEYTTLAARIITSNLHKKTRKVFSEVVTEMREAPETAADIEPIYETVMANRNVLDEMIIYMRDYNIPYEELKKLQSTHLRRINGSICERPQHYIVRRLVSRYGPDIERIEEQYHSISSKPEAGFDAL